MTYPKSRLDKDACKVTVVSIFKGMNKNVEKQKVEISDVTEVSMGPFSCLSSN